jgi:hypothetical protein
VPEAVQPKLQRKAAHQALDLDHTKAIFFEFGNELVAKKKLIIDRIFFETPDHAVGQRNDAILCIHNKEPGRSEDSPNLAIERVTSRTIEAANEAHAVNEIEGLGGKGQLAGIPLRELPPLT